LPIGEPLLKERFTERRRNTPIAVGLLDEIAVTEERLQLLEGEFPLERLKVWLQL
jgi:hypothetical protein